MENFNKLIPIDGENGEKRTISSLQIAEITGKAYCGVLKVIRKMDIMRVKITMKNIFSLFVCLKNCCTFAVLTVRQTLLLRRAAVNCSMVIGHFLCLILNDIRRLSIRSHCFVLRGKVCWTVSSVYGNRFSVVYNDLNAYSHE